MSPTLQRKDYVRGCLRRGFTALCKDRDTAIELVNSLAPEHLELMVEGAAEMAGSISNAGLILTGPTRRGRRATTSSGRTTSSRPRESARLRAGLTALDFVKVSWVVEGHEGGPEGDAPVPQGARHGGGPAEPLPVRAVEVPEAMTQRQRRSSRRAISASPRPEGGGFAVNRSSKELLGKVDAVAFDCDGVLIDARRSYDATIRVVVETMVEETAGVRLRLARRHAEAHLDGQEDRRFQQRLGHELRADALLARRP